MDLHTFTNLINVQYLAGRNTVLKGGFDEPFYKAPSNGHSAEIRYTKDYIRSAMHELAHWCIAGPERRRQDDFGYWYAADGRNQIQQEAFFKVEARPQAIEWAFAILCDVPFEVSADNLDAPSFDPGPFKDSVQTQAAIYLERGFPIRAREVMNLLYNTRKDIHVSLVSHLANAMMIESCQP